MVVFGGSYGGSKLTPTSLSGMITSNWLTIIPYKLCYVVCYVLGQCFRRGSGSSIPHM